MNHHQHITPCSCIGTCSVVIITEWDSEGDQPEEWYAEFFQHIRTRKGFRDRWRVFWGVLRGQEPYTHGVVLHHDAIVDLRDFLNERTADKDDREDLDGWRVQGPELREPIEVVPRFAADALAAALREIADGHERHNPGWWIKKAKAALAAYGTT